MEITLPGYDSGRDLHSATNEFTSNWKMSLLNCVFTILCHLYVSSENLLSKHS